MKYFKNITDTSADMYIYGEIVDEKVPDWWTGEVSNTEVDVAEMRDELNELTNTGVRDLNIYINSPGGSVFASSTIVSMLKRFKQESNATITSYIDGLCASAATYILMVADNINVYQNSILMIHKPMTVSIGNANDLQKDLDTLNTIENDMMLPMYMNKSLVDEDTIKNLVNSETWFNGNEKDELFIGNFFNINYLEEAKDVVACSSNRLFKNYKHTPAKLLNVSNRNKETETRKEKIDYSSFENIIKSLNGGVKNEQKRTY